MIRIDTLAARGKSPSPHLLDLRGRHRAPVIHAPLTFTIPWTSRVLGVVARWWIRNAHRRASMRQAAHLALPSFDVRKALSREYRFSDRMRTVTIVSFAVMWILAVRALGQQQRSLRRSPRIIGASLRYGIRRVILFVRTFRTEGARGRAEGFFARVALPLGRLFPRSVVLFAGMGFILIVPVSVAALSYSVPTEAEAVGRAHTLLAMSETAFAQMTSGSWDDAALLWKSIDADQEDLARSTFLTNPIIGPLLTHISTRARSADALLRVFDAITVAGTALTDIGKTLSTTTSLSARIVAAEEPLHSLVQALAQIDTALTAVDPASVPEPYREQLASIARVVPDVRHRFEKFGHIISPLPTLLGHERPMRYLVVFQNEAELRPTGGFIGSMAILDVSQGALAKMFISPEGSYALQGALKENQRAPRPLQHINARWEFQDANWWPDFPRSAEKILWFWDNAEQPTVDGVIAVNSGLFERLLALVGPIPLPDYGVTITADNFFLETERQVELLYDKEANTPKRFLRDLGDAVIRAMEERGSDDALPLLLTLLQAVDEKDAQIYLRDPALQEAILGAGLAGTIDAARPYEDTLMVVHTNIGGEKTDRVIRDSILHEAAIDSAGVITNTVTINRTHRGVRGELFTGVPNDDYVRVYVPMGATLVRAEGFGVSRRAVEVPPAVYATDPAVAALEVTPMVEGLQTSPDLGYTVFGGWVNVDPGEVQTVRITYTLPFSLPDGSERVYRFRAIKQAGMRGATIAHTLGVPTGWRTVRHVPSSDASPRLLDMDAAYLSVITAEDDYAI